jgi:hypothetical protein
METFTVRREFIEGPLDGHSETVEVEGWEPDLSLRDVRSGTWHHYALADVPDTSRTPPRLLYRHVSEFDPESDYYQQVISVREEQTQRWLKKKGMKPLE